MRRATDFDAVVVGASLAGCTTAILLARAGANVLLLERATEMSAYKSVCGHNIQGSAIPVIQRLGLLEPMLDAGAIRSRTRIWAAFCGWIEPPPHGVVERSINLRRVHLDPILRALANDQDGVDLQLGSSVVEIDDSEPDSVSVEFQDRAGVCTRVTAQLAIGADGRNSTVAKLKGIKQRTKKNGRFNYAAYFSGPKPDSAPDINGWFGNPQWAGSFPTDSELVGYYIMPTKDRLPQFKQDLEGSIREVISGLPAAPPVDELTLEGKIIGDVELPGIRRERVSGRIALVGDAALTSDPLFGVGCGWAFQSGEWLADAIAPALIGDVPLRPALKSYSRRARRELFPHAFQVDNYSSGRRLDPMERLTFKAAARDPQIAVELQRVGTRITKGTAFMRPANQARMVRAQFKSSST